MLTGQNVLLTGAGSPIGQGLVPRILEQDPTVLRLFDSNESHLEELMERFDDDRLRYLMGRVRDEQRVERAMEDVDVVLHIAGMRHAGICEQNPFEAVQTNVFGLQNVVEAAIESGVENVVFISSVDPVNPAHTMGAAELLGEKVISEANDHKGDHKTELVTARVGNIWHSSDSAIPRFAKQIRNGGPITLNGEGISRFFFTHDDVFGLISQALTHGRGGEVFIWKMPAVRLEDLVEVMVDQLAPQFGYEPTDLEVVYSDDQLNVKSNEEMMTKKEAFRAYENDLIYVIPPEGSRLSTFESQDEFSILDGVPQSSESMREVEKSELVDSLADSEAYVLDWRKMRR